MSECPKRDCWSQGLGNVEFYSVASVSVDLQSTSAS